MSDDMPTPPASPKGGGKGLKKNLGPLPVWAWGVILAIIIVVYIWLGQSRGATGGDDTPAEDTGDATRDAIDGAFRIGGAYTGDNSGNGGKDDSADTNDAWSFRAVAALVSKGKLPLAAQQAIYLYLDGETLTAAQQALVDEAIKLIGAPPERPPTPKLPTPPKPATPIRTPTKTVITYTAVKGDTLVGVARRYKMSKTRILALNKLKAIRKLKVGEKIKVEI